MYVLPIQCQKLTISNLNSACFDSQLVQDIVHTKAELENSLKAVNFGGLDWQLTLSLIDEMNIVLRTAPFNNDVYVCRNMEEYIERTTSFALKTMREEFLSMLSFNVDQCVENSISVDPATSSNSGEAQESENTAIPDKDKEKYLELLIVNLCKRNGLRESLDAYGHASEMSTRRIVV